MMAAQTRFSHVRSALDALRRGMIPIPIKGLQMVVEFQAGEQGTSWPVDRGRSGTRREAYYQMNSINFAEAVPGARLRCDRMAT